MREVIFRCQNIITVMLFVSIITVTGCSSQAGEEKLINVVFRFDDYSAKSSTDIELKIIDAFRKHNASITFGVIPFICAGSSHDPYPQDVVPLTSMKSDILKTAFMDGIVDIALHGYSHQTINAKKMTEFSGLDYNSQVDRLAKGKKFLETIINAPVTTFVPPWDSYDLNTLRALEDLGFSTISSDGQGEAMENSTLNFLPATCALHQLRDAVREAKSSFDTQPVIVVLFHSYDFREVNEKRGNITFQEFSDLLDWLLSRGDVRLLSIGQATRVINDLGAHRFLWNHSKHPVRKLIPSFLRKGGGNQYPEPAKWLWLFVGVFYLIIAILGAIASFLIGWFVFPKSTVLMNICIYGGTAVSIIILIYAFHDLDISLHGMKLSAGVVGASFGAWLCFLYLKKKA